MFIELKNVSKYFGKKSVLNQVNLSIHKNRILCLQGSNGAGKSTLIKLICDLYRPSSGEIILEEQLHKNQIGYLSQSFSMYEDLTVYENLAFFATLYGMKFDKKSIIEHLKNLKLDTYKDYLAGNLSGGWQQKLGLACATIHQPKLLILDEPTAGVDYVSRQEIWEYIRQLKHIGVTIIVTTHYMDEVLLCDEVAFLHEGNILLDVLPPQQMLDKYNYPNFELLFYDAIKGGGSK
ncbi:ABC transporter ATP-binding protein [Listeria monocytogenes]|uniref:ABC transporter ATP-binding protein n=1 Tax=Listeria TaxID=1637 RepID=UPI0011EAB4DC|nr:MULTISPECIES: ABC transporter ATP-binding protein [Listeria]EBF5117057.1 ABC transporter ATP-binding protein [Listeria monocytogenes]EBF5125889.1 ABC transporter ATP-binding protein [Listeria monocytogenes]EBF5152285.1 ABC transporter ATP-binding protein [Listeria monocytogenes]EHD1589121.1 ABC transporter ATP-binding protein [Listeria monocytogenes]EHK4067803.1 ABC transporter ATP-binding protein [Listeria monocytogenes]